MTKAFWNKEYANPTHLKMSTLPASDMETFAKWAERNAEWPPFPQGGLVLDVGCGNGRNLIHLCSTHNMRGYGFDISSTAIEQAKKMADTITRADGAALGKHLTFKAQGAADPIDLPDQSVAVALDMMSSHFLRADERKKYVKELARVMQPYGWFFFKTFVLEGDVHAKRLVSEHKDPQGEENSYIHPRIGVYEHIWTEEEIAEVFRPYFKIFKMMKSYKHVRDNKAYKRRTVSVYMERLKEE